MNKCKIIPAKRFLSLLADKGYRDYKFISKSLYYSRGTSSTSSKNICAKRISVVYTSGVKFMAAETIVPPIGEIIIVPTCDNECHRATTKEPDTLANPVTCNNVNLLAKQLKAIIKSTTKTILLIGSCCDTDIWSVDRISGVLHPKKVLCIGAPGLRNEKFEKGVKKIGVDLVDMGVLKKQGILR